jgi:MFS family permease
MPVDSAIVVDAAAERETGSVPERQTGSVPERQTGSVPERQTGSVPERPTGALAAFRSREFSVFFTAGFLSNTGTWMQTVTVPFVIDQLTHSTALVGVSAFAAFFPATVIGPLAGSLADRHDRRTVLIWAQVVMMAMATALWITWATGVATTPSILVCVVISGLGAGITTAAWQSFVPQLVPRSDLLSAVRVNSMQFTAARAFGPALAGLVLATLGASWAFGANAISFLCVIGALLVIAPRPPLHPSTGSRVLTHFREGVHYVRQRAVLFIAVLMVVLIALFGVAIVQLVEPIARHVFHVGAGRYGLMTGAYGLGAVIGGVFTVAYGDTFRRSRLALLGLAMMALGDIVLGVTPFYPVALAALIAMGLAQVLCMVSCNTAIQLNVDESYRGRASSMFTMSFFAAAPIGALIGGIVGDILDLRVTIVGAGVILAACVVLSAIRFHGLQPLDEAPPVLDEIVGTVRERPPPTDLDSPAHLVVEPVDSA